MTRPARSAAAGWDYLIVGICKHGLHALKGITVKAAADTGHQRAYSIPAVQKWLDGNVDEFSDRAETANEVFRANLSMVINNRAQDPANASNLDIMAVNNAFNSRFFKRSANSKTDEAGESNVGRHAHRHRQGDSAGTGGDRPA